MTHCTMNELLAVRGGEGTAAAVAHLAECDGCRRELELIDQRVAAMRALSTRRPPRDRWPVVRERIVSERKRSGLAQAGWASLAVAAGLALAVGVRGIDFTPRDARPAAASAETTTRGEVARLVAQSQQLEAALRDWDPRGRVLNGRAASVIAELEDRIAAVDAGISQITARDGGQTELVNLWRDRVQLMDALVNAHVTRATYVGF